MKNKKKIIIAAVAALVILSLLSRCGGAGGSNKISVKNGVLAIVPELKMGMTFNQIPTSWLPEYVDASEEIGGKPLEDSIYIYFDDDTVGYEQTKDVKYEGVEFYTRVSFNLGHPMLAKDEMDSKPMIKEISCVAYNVTEKQKDKIVKKLKSHYGNPTDSNKISGYWRDGDYIISYAYEREELKIEMSY